MQKLITIVILTACACLPSFSQTTEYSRSGSVWFEVRNDTANPCRYTEDNKIYQAEREFTFGFHYYDPQGKERYMRYERIPKQGYELTETGDTATYTYYMADFSFSDVLMLMTLASIVMRWKFYAQRSLSVKIIIKRWRLFVSCMMISNRDGHCRIPVS